MKLPDSNFYKGNFTYGLPGSARKLGKRFTYESSKVLYDVDIFEDGNYRFSCNQAAYKEPCRFHQAIISHFNLVFTGVQI